MTKAYGTFEHRQVMTDAHEEIEKILESPFEKRAQGLFDVLIWLESKTKSVSMAEIISGQKVLINKED